MDASAETTSHSWTVSKGGQDVGHKKYSFTPFSTLPDSVKANTEAFAM